jgi:hypothetical protein
MTRSIIHVNQHVIKRDQRTGNRDPVLTVKRDGQNIYGHEVVIYGQCKIIYRPDDPLSCGATVWIETNALVRISRTPSRGANMVERDVVKPPNKEDAAGNMKNNGFLSLAGSMGAVKGSNIEGRGGDRRDGSFPLTAGPVMAKPREHRFNVGQVGMPDQPFPAQPGKGTVPVNPFLPGGAAARSMPVSDMAPKR